jgi:asparaginyl-tRNA synthetase
MKDRLDKKTVSGFDLIFPSIGELVGGSLREKNSKTLQTKAQKQGIDTKKLA